MSIAIIVHGGSGMIADERAPFAIQGCREAMLAGWEILQQGGTALAAVETAVRALEDNPTFNAGTGSCLNRDGQIEMDAGIMEGHTLNMGAVAGIERLKHPITAARHVLESPHVMLIGEGAQEFAVEQGMELCTQQDLLTERQYRAWKEGRNADLTPLQSSCERRSDAATERATAHVLHAELSGGAESSSQARSVTQLSGTLSQDEHDTSKKHGTVGAVAIDGFGILAAATSTGGFMNKVQGRVGDSPLVGCGFYADEYAAISCTGYGEDFTRLLIARRAAEFVERGQSAQEAAEAAIAFLSKRASGWGGLIVVDREGRIGFARNSTHMAYAYLTEGITEAQAGV